MAKPKRAMPSGKDLINYDFTYATLNVPWAFTDNFPLGLELTII